MKREVISFILMLSAVFQLRAQFYTDGCESALIPMSQLETDNYRVVFHSGMDSLARVYARKLEQVRVPVGQSIGFLPNQQYRKRMPVILYPEMTESNGMVSWTPRRMELYTTPDYSAPYPDPWEDQLCIHESRHVSQMQFGNSGYFRPLHWIVGEISEGALSAVYPGKAFMEGDAVVAETALTNSGRGRDADFLEYYRACFAEGQRRDYWQWQYGGLKRYSPGIYQAGYMFIGGMRSVFGVQSFTNDYFNRISDKFIPFWNLQKTVKDKTGKSLRTAFEDICDAYALEWENAAQRRRPWVDTRTITSDSKFYTDLKPAGFLRGKLYVYGGGTASVNALYSVDSLGALHRVRRLASSVSQMKPCDLTGEIYFSEYRRNARWERKSSSVICSVRPDGTYRQITSGTRYFNPSPSPDGMRISVTKYRTEGGSSVDIISSGPGILIESIPAPDGMQVVETEWIGESIYASAITSEGEGIYDVTDGWKCLLLPGKAKIKQLTQSGGRLYFTCDLDGVCGLYVLEDGEALMLTPSRQGLSGFRFNAAADSLVCAELSSKGRHIVSVNPAGLTPREIPATDPYPFATQLKAGEPDLQIAEPVIGEPEKYNRFAHLFNVHSWAPCYIDYDNVASMSLESLQSAAGLGATAFFQNELSTLQATASWHIEPGDRFRNSAHINLIYSGLYPVFEFKGSVNAANATNYRIETGVENGTRFKSILGIVSANPLWTGTLKTYIPWVFNSGGMLRGLVPQISATFTNEKFEGKLWGRVSASLRGYTMEPVPSSCIYPRWGIGAEAGYSTHMAVSAYIRPLWYVSAYGYLPGFYPTHSIKITGVHSQPVGSASFCENYINILPRGYVSGYAPVAYWPKQSRFTFDYVFPFLSLEWSRLSPLAYVRNLEGGVHFDTSLFGEEDGNTVSLCSAGATVKVRLENLLWIPFPARIGVTYSHNFGSFDEDFKKMWPYGKRNYVEFVFSVDL